MITYAAQRYRNGQTVITNPSPFIRDIDARYLNPSNGTLLNADSPNSYDIGLNKYKQSFHSSSTGFRSEPSRSGSAQRPISNSFQRQGATSSVEVSAEYCIHQSSMLKPGMKIEHPRFGQGVIESVDTDAIDHKVKVRFANVDTKVLLLKFAKFKILD